MYCMMVQIEYYCKLNKPLEHWVIAIVFICQIWEPLAIQVGAKPQIPRIHHRYTQLKQVLTYKKQRQPGRR